MDNASTNLPADAAKMRFEKAARAYLRHLWRKIPVDPEVERFLLSKNPEHKPRTEAEYPAAATAFVEMIIDGQRWVFRFRIDGTQETFEAAESLMKDIAQRQLHTYEKQLRKKRA